MPQIRFGDLTDEQKDFIIDGCGKKGGILDVPDWIFTASCAHHDFNYWLGHTEEDRKKADWQFYQAMLYDANNAPWYKRAWYKLMAWTYYRAVSTFAKEYFYYGDAERTLEDLEAEMASKET